jgi:hemoglobin
MKDAHKGLEITNADFDALVGDLVKALDDNKVAEADKKELLGLLAPMRKDVVEKAE